MEITTRSAAETRALAGGVATLLEAGDLVLLHGDLGTGKTAFVQGLARGLELVDEATSPTFALVHEHLGGRLRLLHVDLYRLEDHGSAELGLEDELDDGRTVAAIEWAERGAPTGDALDITISQGDEDDERTLSHGPHRPVMGGAAGAPAR